MSNTQPQEPADRQHRVEALAEEYLDGLLAGKVPDRQAVLAAHPDVADSGQGNPSPAEDELRRLRAEV